MNEKTSVRIQMDNNPQNDYTFYAGFEGETEMILYLGEERAYHIWKGYFDDVFDTPSLDGNNWTGFTRDYHQSSSLFSGKRYMAAFL